MATQGVRHLASGTVRSALAAVVLLGILLTAAGASAQYLTYYKDQPITRSLDTTHVAVRMASDPAGQKTQFAALGLLADQAESMAVGSWWKIPVSPDKSGANSVEALVAALAARPDVAFAAPIFTSDDHGPVIPTEHLMVSFAADVSRAEAEALVRNLDAGARLGEPGWGGLDGTYYIELSTRNGFTAQEIANSLATSGRTRFSENDALLTATFEFIPNDPGFASQWGLNNTGQTGGTFDADMDAVEAWDITTGDASVLVAVFDVGVQQDHPDLNVVTGVDVTSDGPGDGGPVGACDLHGTAVAGCISQIINNGVDGSGVAPDCPVFSVRMGTGSVCGSTSFSTAFSWLINGLTEAENAGCKVSNHSYGGLPVSATFEAKLTATRNNGMVHFVSSGNSGAASIGYPASAPDVNAVGAINHFGNRASFSQYGTGLDFVAPGQTIWTTDRTGADGYGAGDYLAVDGTSFASPYAAGVAALAFSVNPNLDAATVESVMQTSAVDAGAAGYDTQYGYGIVNANNVVNNTPCPPPSIGVSSLVINLSVAFGATDAAVFQIDNLADCDDLVWTLSEQEVPGGGDAAWLTTSVTAGTIPAEAGTNVTVNVDGALLPGSYACDLLINSNDTANPVVTVTVNLTVTGSLANTAPGVIYGSTGYAGSGEFLTIDPVTGAATLVGNTGVGGMGSLAVNAAGELFGVGGPNGGTQHLYRIDTATGIAAFVGPTGVSFMGSLVFDTSGTLYGIGDTGPDKLYTIDPATGAVTPGPAVNPGITGLAFDPTTGVLYATEYAGGSGIDNLHTLDPGTGATTLIGSLGLGVGIGDIHFDNAGNLFGVVGGGRDPNNYVSIDKVTGVATIIGLTGIDAITGLARFGTPEIAASPASLALSVPFGDAASQPLQVGNIAPVGSAPLDWTLTEQDVPGGGDCAWLTASLAAGSTTAGAATGLTIDVNAFALAPGVYNCDLEIASNDPGTPLLVVPVQLTVTGTPANVIPGVVYGSQGYAGTGEFLQINQTTGAASIIGNTGVGGIGALAINSAGELYGVGGPGPGGVQNLYRIDAATGKVILIGDTGVQFMQAMAFDSSDVLHGVGDLGADKLYTIDTATGAVTPGSAVSPNLVGFAFDPTDGTLYAAEYSGGTGIDNLLTVDLVTGATTLIGSLGLGVGIGDVHFDNAGNLYGVVGGGRNPNDYVSIDKNTGLATVIGPTGIPAITGLASLGTPGIAVTPTSLSLSLPLGGAGNVAFDVQNLAPAGSSALEWTLAEQNVPGGGDCIWLSAAPVVGSTPGASATTVNLALNAFGLAPGVYACDLEISSNDPVTPLLTVPVQLTVTGSLTTATPGDIYATQGYSGSGELLRIDPLSGAATVIGNTGVGGLPGLAINAAGEIYGVGGVNSSDQNLFRIDAATGAVVFIGDTGLDCFQAMAFDGTGVLWGVGTCGPDNLYTVDTATGVLTTVAPVDPNMVGLAFDPTTGDLYGVEWNQSSALDGLYVVDTVTGATTLVGSLGLGRGVGDIHFDAAGNLFGVVGGGQSTNDYVSIDKNTGVGTIIGAVGFPAVTGLTFAPTTASPVPDTPELPQGFALHSAAPNPFNPTTRITYELPRDSKVTINVYDPAGRRVRTIVEGHKTAGVHTATFSADRLSSGLYFYEMRAGDFHEVRKMTLVK